MFFSDKSGCKYDEYEDRDDYYSESAYDNYDDDYEDLYKDEKESADVEDDEYSETPDESNDETIGAQGADEYDKSDQVGKTYTKEEWKQIVADFLLTPAADDDSEAVQDKKDRQQAAGEKIANAMLPFIIYLAHSFYGTYFRKYGDDMIQEGYLGVMESIRTYDPERGKPTTWCSKSIIHNMREFVSRNVHNTTSHYRTHIHEIKKMMESREKANENMSLADIQIEQNISPTTVDACLQVDRRNAKQMSIDQSISDDNKATVSDMVASTIPDPETAYIRQYEIDNIYNAMKTSLTEQEFLVTTLYYGMDDGKTKSFAEISKITNIPKQYLRSIQNSALTKLEACLGSQRMYDADKKERSKSFEDVDDSFSKQVAMMVHNIMGDDLHSFDLSGLEIA